MVTPLKSLMATGRLGGANFSPNVGEAWSNSDEKSSRMNPLKCVAAGVLVQMKNSAWACIWSSRTSSLRSHSGREAPANGATWPDSGEMLMKSGTMRTSPTHGEFSVVSPPGPKPATLVRPIVVVGLPLLPAGVPLALYGFAPPMIGPVYAGLFWLL